MIKKFLVFLVNTGVLFFALNEIDAAEVKNNSHFSNAQISAQKEAFFSKKEKINENFCQSDQRKIIKQKILDAAWKDYKIKATLSLALLPLVYWMSKENSAPLLIWAIITTLAVGHNIWNFEKQYRKIK